MLWTYFLKKNKIIHLPDADTSLYTKLFFKTEADTYFKLLKNETEWQEDDITLFGKTYKQPRLTAVIQRNSNSPTPIQVLLCILNLLLQTLKELRLN